MSNNKAYVSDATLPDLAPPLTSVGPFAWVKNNLFSSPLNAILTLASIFLLYKIIPPALDWSLFNAVWSAQSAKECRELSGGHGACWAVVIVRFKQMIYGFYPNELQWRPSLAFIGMILAVAPILFDLQKSTRIIFSVLMAVLGILFWMLVGGGVLYILGVVAMIALAWLPQSRMLVFSALFPVLVYWLIWGGSVWGVLLFLLSLVACVFIYVALSRVLPKFLGDGPGNLFAIIGAIFVLLAIWIVGVGFLVPNNVDEQSFFGAIEENPSLLTFLEYCLTKITGFVGLEPVESSRLGGFTLTILLGVTGIICSLPLGILLALGRQSDMLFIKTMCVGFIEMVRGVPLITLLFVASTLLNYFLPPGTTFDLILRVVIMVTLFAAAYMAEVIRGGLAALPSGQFEAADALGLDYNKAMRLIVMPQALKISIPGIVNTFIGLFKDTTLVSIIGLLDPLGLIPSIQSDIKWGGTAEEFYVFIALVFFVFCFAMSRYSMHLENKLATGHR